MRFDIQITFVKVSEKKYNPEVGKHTVGIETKLRYWAHVADLGTERGIKLFGELKEGQKAIILRMPFYDSWDYAVIDGQKYKMVTSKVLKRKHAFLVELI
jgi:hypothetical protein